MAEYLPIPSPCIGVCRLDEDAVCMGCFRSSEEITYWRLFSDEERKAVMERINSRGADD